MREIPVWIRKSALLLGLTGVVMFALGVGTLIGFLVVIAEQQLVVKFLELLVLILAVLLMGGYLYWQWRAFFLEYGEEPLVSTGTRYPPCFDGIDASSDHGAAEGVERAERMPLRKSSFWWQRRLPNSPKWLDTAIIRATLTVMVVNLLWLGAFEWIVQYTVYEPIAHYYPTALVVISVGSLIFWVRIGRKI